MLVTGGNSGIGWTCCMALSKQNAKIYLTARDLQKGQRCAALHKPMKEAVFTCQGHVTDMHSINALRSTCM